MRGRRRLQNDLLQRHQHLAGMDHSGDINSGEYLLHHVNVDRRLESGKEFVIFVSGFQNTKLLRFKERNPIVMIANHAEKVSQRYHIQGFEYGCFLQYGICFIFEGA